MSALPGMSGVGMMGSMSGGVAAQSPSAAANAALEAALSGTAFGAGVTSMGAGIGAGLPPMGGQVNASRSRVSLAAVLGAGIALYWVNRSSRYTSLSCF